MSLKGLELCESLPPLDELQKFNAASQAEDGGAGGGGDLAGLIHGLQEGGAAEAGGTGAAGPRFEKGDRVLVVEGERFWSWMQPRVCLHAALLSCTAR